MPWKPKADTDDVEVEAEKEKENVASQSKEMTTYLNDVIGNPSTNLLSTVAFLREY